MPVEIAANLGADAFAGLEEILTKLSRPPIATLTPIEQAVRAGFAGNFATQMVGGGAPWPGLAPRTQRERARAGYGATGPMLRRTDAYRQSWITSPGWRQIDYGAGGWTLFITSAHPWAEAHELGVRSRNLPARAVRYLDTPSMRGIATAVDQWAMSVVASVPL